MFVLVRPATYVIRQANIGITRAQADLTDGMGGVRQSSQLQLKETVVPHQCYTGTAGDTCLKCRKAGVGDEQCQLCEARKLTAL